jgi:hypothetical protein
MSDWKINLSYHERTDPLDVAAIERSGAGLEGDDRRVAQKVVFDAVVNPEMQTVGDLLDHLEGLGQQGRRELLNDVRRTLDLPTTESVDAARESEAWRAAHAHLEQRDEFGFVDAAVCAADGCLAIPINPQTGGPARTNARRWWCSAHADQAAPGDLEPFVLRVRYGPSGDIQFIDREEAEARRQEHEQRRFRAEREARQAERAQEAEELRRHEAALEEHFRPKGAGWE